MGLTGTSGLNIRPTPLNTPERFWSRVEVTDHCWPWTLGKDKDGYGLIRYQNRRMRAHRLAWELTHGPIPKDMHVLHHCDNPPCCNPEHLFLGTELDNRRDCIAKGRSSSGEKHPAHLHPEYFPYGERTFGAKLTDAAVRTILSIYEPGRTRISEIATEYGVTVPAIIQILSGKSWKHITKGVSRYIPLIRNRNSVGQFVSSGINPRPVNNEEVNR